MIIAAARHPRNQENIGLGPIARYHIEHESKLLEYWILLFHYLKLEALTAFPNEYVKTEFLPFCPKPPET